MVRISTPATDIQAWRVPLVSARGSPEEKPSRVITVMRLLLKT